MWEKSLSQFKLLYEVLSMGMFKTCPYLLIKFHGLCHLEIIKLSYTIKDVEQLHKTKDQWSKFRHNDIGRVF